MIAMNQNPTDDDPSRGRGEANYLTPTQQNHIVRMVTNPKRRFKITPAIKREMIETSRRNMTDDDGRVANAAVSNLIKMESLNQADEHHADGETVNHVHSLDERRSRLAAISQRLGIDGVVIDATTAPATIDNPAVSGS